MLGKVIVLVSAFVCITGCGDRERYREAVLAQLKQEKDINDYKIEHNKMADCILAETSKNMKGVLDFDPIRVSEYQKYTKLLNLKTTPDPQKTLKELREEFGGAQDLANANANFSESLFECMSALVTDASESEQKKN